MTSGWIFDAYPLDDKLIIWIKNGKTVRLEQDWMPSIYVGCNSKKKLGKLEWNQAISHYVDQIQWVDRFERAWDAKKSKVLKIRLESSNILHVAKKIEVLDKFGVYRLYNVDVPPEQAFFYEKQIFPLGKFKSKGKTWTPLDDIKNADYKLPKFSHLKLKVVAANKQKIPKFSDKIKEIQINGETIQNDSEEQMILECIRIVQKNDPDFIFTNNGDSWDFPFLAHRAAKNNISEKLIFGREKTPTLAAKRPGNSYFSYGQIHYKPTATVLQGRVHIDLSNCFIWENDYSIHGLYEIARMCMLPLQTAARASIGKCMSSVQFCKATRRDLLIPWKPVVSEIFKSRMDLLVGDRGGLVLEPRIGVHQNVAAIDFAALFGNIMYKKNVSAETINCSCCPNSTKRVPELGYRICKRTGIVPHSLELLLSKRDKYTKLIEITNDQNKIKIYKARKAALKWILVTSFGYLGFNNAKFGRIDAHMAVCAFARNILLRSMKIAERHGFEVLHGLVDSLWIQKNGAVPKDYMKIKNQIEKETGFGMSCDLYNWIAFLPSKKTKKIPVPNRYFGALQDGTLKIRGIEARRHDTPNFFKACQLEILTLFSRRKTINDIKKAVIEAKSIQKKYEDKLTRGEVLPKDLVFTNRLTKATGEYKSNTIQADAVNQLRWEGKPVAAGQKIRYIINDYSRKISKRVIPLEIAPPNSEYDVKRYIKLLDECCKSILEPFEDPCLGSY